jgi:hypothetical protein
VAFRRPHPFVDYFLSRHLFRSENTGIGIGMNDESIFYPHKELNRVPADLSKFWVITVLSNPVRYKRRYELYWRFAEMCEHAGVRLVTVEQAFGNRRFMVTSPTNPYHLQVRTIEELWHKENMINLGIKHACAIAQVQGLEVREVAWVDADCRSTRTPRDWFEETWHQLQHYEFVQMWENMIDLDLNQNPIGSPQPSFMANYIKYGSPGTKEFLDIQFGRGKHGHGRHHHHKHHHHHHHKHHHHHHHHNPPPYPYDGGVGNKRIFGRSGLAWAANLDAWNKVGGLVDFSILGANDWYTAHSLIGSLYPIIQEWAHTPYGQKLLHWQERAERWIKRDVGYVPGTVYHDFHGKKINRGYNTRGKILIDNKFNPETDIKYDGFGLLQLETWEPRQIRMRDQIRAYFRARSEDDTSVE